MSVAFGVKDDFELLSSCWPGTWPYSVGCMICILNNQSLDCFMCPLLAVLGFCIVFYLLEVLSSLILSPDLPLSASRSRTPE